MADGLCRALGHAKQLLSLIATFPTTNPTPVPAPSSAVTEPSPDPPLHPSPSELTTSPSSAAEIDLPSLLSSIRAKYKILCTSLSARPRLIAAPSKDGRDNTGDFSGLEGDGVSGVVEGIEGPMKGVDTRQLRF
jgi:hypothetical protein